MLVATVLDIFPRAAPAVPSLSGRARKTRSSGHRPNTYKPLPLVSRFQRYKRQEQVARASSAAPSSSSLSSAGSGSSSSDASTIAAFTANATPPPLTPSTQIEPALHHRPEADPNISDPSFFRVQLAQMRLRAHCHRLPAPEVFHHPGVRARLARQWERDATQLFGHPNNAVPVYRDPVGQVAGQAQPPQLPLAPLESQPRPMPGGLPPTRSGAITNSWHRRVQAAEESSADRGAYARARGLDPVTLSARWSAYRARWRQALDPARAPLAFADVPWPVPRTPLHAHAHAPAPADVHRFLLHADTPRGVPYAAVPRLTAEIERWRAEHVRAVVLPRVVEAQRGVVARAAELVFRILVAARREIVQFHRRQ